MTDSAVTNPAVEQLIARSHSLGADLTTVLFGRLAFAIVATAAIAFVLERFPDAPVAARDSASGL